MRKLLSYLIAFSIFSATGWALKWELPPSLPQAEEDKKYLVDLREYVVSYGNNTNLTFSMKNAPEFLTLDPSGILHGTATAEYIGEYSIYFAVKDDNDKGSVAKSTLTVVPNYVTFMFTQNPIGWENVCLDKMFSANLSDYLVYSGSFSILFQAESLPSWLKLNGMTGELYGLPIGIKPGKLEFSVGALAGDLSTGATVILNVKNCDSNLPPTWSKSTYSLGKICVGSKYEVAVDFTSHVFDPEGETLSFTVKNLPPEVTADLQSHLFVFEPKNKGKLSFSIVASDSVHESSANVSVKVVDCF